MFGVSLKYAYLYYLRKKQWKRMLMERMPMERMEQYLLFKLNIFYSLSADFYVF